MSQVVHAKGDGKSAAPEDEDTGTFVTARSHSSERPPSWFQRERASSFSSYRSSSTSTLTAREAISPSNLSRTPAPSQTHYKPGGSLSIVLRLESCNDPLPRSTASLNGNPDSPPPERAPTSVFRFGRKRNSIADKRTEDHGSVTAASMIDKVQEISGRKDRRLCTVSEFSEFDSHPIIRPLEVGKAPGEAGHDDENDPTQYPGRLALSLIVVGICLSVFVISLDRNIITTVRLSCLVVLSAHCSNRVSSLSIGNSRHHGKISFLR